jgi:hypothetical protein
MTRYTPQWLQQGVYAAGVDRRLIGALWPSSASVGAAVTVASGMGVNVAAGQIAVPAGNGTGSVLCSSDAVEVVTLASAPTSPNNRIDLVICQARGNDLDAGSNNDFIFTTVTGTPATTPTVPAVPANAAAIAQVYVPGNSAAIVAGNITDVRPALLNATAEPATTSAALVSRPDLTGEIWVARAGVNGGLWKKARNVLHAGYYRNGAFTVPTTAGALAADTVLADPYGLYNPSNGQFTPPVAGLWQVAWSLWAASAAAGNTLQAIITNSGGSQIAVNTAHAAAGGLVFTSATLLVRALAGPGDFQTTQMAGSAPLTGRAVYDTTRVQIDYLGTG